MKFFDKLKNKKNILIFFVLFFSLIFLFLPQPVAAGIDDVFAWLIGGLSRMIISALGFILVRVIGVLIDISQYNNFINEAPVANGWALIRDISNMFFVIILLVIAFATILRIERYNYKKWLPKLLMMAILINFSKTICGLLIDATQVVMLTFVGAFASIGSGSMVELLGINGWQDIEAAATASKNGKDVVKGWAVVASYVLAVFYVLISLIVITAMVAMLAMRIVMIWLYVVLSPLAFLMAAFPDGAKYSSQWWSDFTKNLIVGPVLAFFIWLAFTSVNSFGTGSSLGQISSAQGSVIDGSVNDIMLKFIIGIGMLIGGMQITQQIGGVAGGMAGKAFSKGKNMALLGAGVAGGALGYNFAKRRFGAWREERKKTVQQKSDLIYESIKGRSKGVVSGLYRATGAKDLVDNNLASEKLRQIKEKKQAKRREKKARTEAFFNKDNEYKDAEGRTYKFQTGTNRYEAEDGTVAMGVDKKPIKKMSEFEAKFHSGMTDSMTKTSALKNQINEEKMSKEQKVFESAGSSVTDLKRVMNNTNETRDKRMAAALQLAIKEGFKNSTLADGRQEVSTAKSIIGDNIPMLKKFEEQVNKRFAALNFDLSNEGGKASYKEALADGRVSGYKQDASTYNEDTIRTLKDYSGKDFMKNISSTMAESKEHRSNITKSVESAKNTDLKNGKVLFDSASGEINEFALLLARSGEVIKAFNNDTTGKKVAFDTHSEDALSKFLETSKAEHISNIDGDILDPNKLDKILSKDGIATTTTDRVNIVNRINFAMSEGLDTTKLATMEKSDKNPEMVKRIIGAIDKYGTSAQKQEVQNNNILKNIKPIVAI